MSAALFVYQCARTTAEHGPCKPIVVTEGVLIGRQCGQIVRSGRGEHCQMPLRCLGRVMDEEAINAAARNRFEAQFSAEAARRQTAEGEAERLARTCGGLREEIEDLRRQLAAMRERDLAALHRYFDAEFSACRTPREPRPVSIRRPTFIGDEDATAVTIIAIERDPSGGRATLSCGHVLKFAPGAEVVLDAKLRCAQCTADVPIIMPGEPVEIKS